MEKDMEMWRAWARAYVCASRDFEQTVGVAAKKLMIQRRREMVAGGALNGTVEREVDQCFDQNAAERIASDVVDAESGSSLARMYNHLFQTNR
jgi:hypothetical protein